MNIVDSHCHLYYEPYVSKLEKTINDCKINNVNLLLSIGVDHKTSLENIKISNKHKEIYCTIGLHPNNVREKKNEIEDIFNLYQKNKKILGIGECGIDLFRSNDNLSNQIEIFEMHIHKAITEKIPVIVHSRSADKETFEVIEKFKNKNIKFILHCFSGDYVLASKYIDLGATISFSGNLTFKNAKIIHETCSKIPIENMLVETDSPYLTPDPFRGKINNPMNTLYVVKKISEIKNIDLENVANITTNNFKIIFDLNS